jgi:phage RecT family recombinase
MAKANNFNKSRDQQKDVQTTMALAVVKEKLGSGAASKYNASRSVESLNWQTEKMYVEQMVARDNYLASAILESPMSLMTALRDSAALGLSIAPSLGHVYLIGQRPKRDLPLEVYAKVSYKGMEQSVLMSGTVLSITTQLVHENDEFDYGTNLDGPFLRFNMARNERGTLQGGFCLARYANGEKHVEWMTAADIEGCKAAATKAQGGIVPAVWSGAFASEQQKKCIVRRAAKHWPSSPVIQRLVENFDRDNPMQFGDMNVIEGDHIEVLGDQHLLAIRESLPNLNDAQASLWMDMAAKARKFDSIREVPVTRFDEIKTALQTRAKLIEERNVAASNAPSNGSASPEEE